jgi:predicted anti-sigma-YlaC factor YlaD
VACEQWEGAISAMVDDEDPGIEPRLVLAHLQRCPSCRAFKTVAESTARAARVQPAPPMPDLSRRIVRLNRIADRASRWGLARAALGVVAVEIVAFSAKPLLLGEESSAFSHDARHLGAFTVAYAVGLLMVVARPARARTMLPVAAVLAGALCITAIIDMARGRVPVITETGHLPELISVLLVWLLAVPSPRRAASAHSPTLRSLRAVADHDAAPRAAGD